jgi:hypothetical protein
MNIIAHVWARWVKLERDEMKVHREMRETTRRIVIAARKMQHDCQRRVARILIICYERRRQFRCRLQQSKAGGMYFQREDKFKADSEWGVCYKLREQGNVAASSEFRLKQITLVNEAEIPLLTRPPRAARLKEKRESQATECTST